MCVGPQFMCFESFAISLCQCPSFGYNSTIINIKCLVRITFSALNWFVFHIFVNAINTILVIARLILLIFVFQSLLWVSTEPKYINLIKFSGTLYIFILYIRKFFSSIIIELNAVSI